MPSPAFPRIARAAVVLAAAVTMAGGRASAQTDPPPTVEPAPGTTALTYALTNDSYEQAFSGPQARVRQPLDLSSAPDGTLFVLDGDGGRALGRTSRSARVPAVHMINADGSLRRIVDLSALITYPQRLDAGWDGTMFIATSSDDAVIHVDASGKRLGRWEIGADVHDIAALPDGRVAVASRDALLILEPSNGSLTTLAMADLAIDPPDFGYTYSVFRVAAAANGHLAATVFAWRDCPQPTSPPRPTWTPAPTATPRPSLARSGVSPAGMADNEPDRDLAALAEVPCQRSRTIELAPGPTFTLVHAAAPAYDDLAAWSGGFFGLIDGTTTVDVFPVGGSTAAATYATARLLPGTRRREVYGRSSAALDVTADGAIVAAWATSDRFFTGPVHLGQPFAKEAPRALAMLDVPAAEGPARPRAVSAGDGGFFVLEGGYTGTGGASGLRRIDVYGALNAIQRWTGDGRLIDQWTQERGGNWVFDDRNYAAEGAPEDIAAVGDRVYVATPSGVWLRRSGVEPDWFAAAVGTRLAAVDADPQVVAALDVAGRRIILWTPDGARFAEWPIVTDGRTIAAADLTVSGGRVYVADAGSNRVLVRALNGNAVGEWRTHDGPLRLDAAPNGDIVVLGRGGWGLRYTADGALRAAWRMPGAFGAKRAQGTDISIGADGQVYVTYSRVNIGSAVDRKLDIIEASGIWSFEAALPPPGVRPTSPDPLHCLVDVAKTAAPTTVVAGQPVTVTLTVSGECPRAPLPQQLMIVLDTSWSMNDGYEYAGTPPGALERARRVLVPLLATLDPAVVDIGLVSFGDGAALDAVLSDDLADLRGRIVRAQADGDTRMGAGVDLAHDELNGPRRNPDARRAILIVSDGVFKDDPRPAVAAARADGIDVHGLIVTTPEFTPPVRTALVDMLGADRLHLDPSPERARALIDAFGAWRDEPGLFESLTVRDVVPANMRYVEGSAVPAADWDATTRTLTWTLGAQPAGRSVTLAFRVIPVEAGTWPTNVEADVDWRDVRGGTGRRTFPVPHVNVGAVHRVYLPLAVRTVCAQWTRPIDLVLVYDVSSTMGQRAADGRRTKLAVAVEAADAFLGRLNPIRDRVGVVAFDADARVVAPLSHDFAAAVGGLASLEPGLGTLIDRGLRTAVTMLTDDSRALALPVVVLLSDGIQNGSVDPVRAVLPDLRALGAEVFTVGFGADVNDGLLREIAGGPEHYRYAPTVEDLRAVFEGVGRTLLCP